MERLSGIMGHKEVKTLAFWKAVLGEFVVTLLYIIIACGNGLHDPKPSVMHGALTTGFTVAVMAGTFWNISGGHFNPAVTIGLAAVGKVPVIRCISYVLAQCLGSAAGAGLLYAYLPASLRGNLGALEVHTSMKAGHAFMIELTLTYQFILCVAAATDPANNFTGFQAPLAIGLSIATGLLMSIPFTGGALNPIRAFGPAVVMDKRADHWVYWIGPIVGAVLATLSYKYVFAQKVAAPEDHRDSGPAINVVVKNNNAYDHGGNNNDF